MTGESDLVARLRGIATHPAARGLRDDAAVLGDLVLTHDMLVEGVHFLPADPPADVAWKLVAVNLSDLAAKGAAPLGVLMGFTLGEPEWNAAFVDGLGAALTHFDVPLLGGDTVSGPHRTLGLTAFGRAAVAPARSGARAGDTLYVTGTVGGAGAGLAVARSPAATRSGREREWLAAYRRPMPRLAEGRLLGPVAHAMMDVSDGLLIDAARMAEASGLAVAIDLDAVPLAPGLTDAMAAATAGDDYELLFAWDRLPPVPATPVGRFAAGAGLRLIRDGHEITPPDKLGWQHG